ncbi:MAG: N-formylglutamate amidohydrolase [Rhodospirillaceae bacterium]|jgi:N-formylglutamate amidohydrolase|nr:N-formylglutamate amidohydrolase [Rhodospirillaceae bacterium]MBT6117215.1 N-formylglutamate amidohydrolase [Rhodospirillaceae bacterium]
MDASLSLFAGWGEAWDVIAPEKQTSPLVFASPHSGTRYSDEFLAASRLDPLTLRQSEDSFVDEIFADAPNRGAPLLRAHFPRAYIDPNREPYELDPDMFADELPSYVNTRSPRVGAGLGTIARVVANGEEIYRNKLNFDEAKARIERCYWPYHQALGHLIESTRAQFGSCLLIDCHSMPSVGGPMDRDAGRRRVDFVLGDVFGTSCAAFVTDSVERFLRERDYNVTRNLPYAGGFTTRHYGRPQTGVHALQIEINRALYMDEDRFERRPYLSELAEAMSALSERLGVLAADALAA